VNHTRDVEEEIFLSRVGKKRKWHCVLKPGVAVWWDWRINFGCKPKWNSFDNEAHWPRGNLHITQITWQTNQSVQLNESQKEMQL